MLKDRLLGGLTVFLVGVGVLCIGYVLYQNISQKNEISKYGNLACVSESYLEKNKDAALDGFISIGKQLKVFKDYYKCNQLERNHAVLFQFSKSIPPVVRIVRGVPGDKYDVVKVEGAEDQWLIKINGQDVPAADGPFFIQSKIIPPLKTYAESRKGVLKDGEFILFSNKAPSISDSSNLGLVRPKEIVGRVIEFDED